MPQPTAYDRQNSFTLIAQENPAEPYTGTQLDAEFNAVKVTLDELLANIALIQRDDGNIANATVGPDQLAAALEIGINPPTLWTTGTAYTQFNTVFVDALMYRALEDHTAGADFATDVAAGKWELIANFLGDFDPETINDGDVTTAKLADGAVTTIKIATGAVNANRLASGAVTTVKIADGAVTESKIADGAVTGNKFADNTVSTAKLQDEAVTLAKIQTIATAKLLGRATAGTGAVEQIDLTAAGRALLDDADAAAQRITLGIKALTEVALTDDATITVDFNSGVNFGVTLGANRTLVASNVSSNIGQKGRIRFTQNAAGSQTLNTSGTPWVNVNGVDIVLSTASNAVDYVYYEILSSTTVLLSLARAVG